MAEKRIVQALGLASLFAIIALCPTLASAQAGESSPPATGISRRADRPTRIYFGMWTTHFKHEVLTLENNWIAGATWHGYFGATFLNSFGRRAFTGGIERHLLSTARRPVRVAAGVRLGFITGYDGRFMTLARKTPVLPLIQPFASVDVKRIGFDVSYTFVVASVAVSYRLSD